MASIRSFTLLATAALAGCTASIDPPNGSTLTGKASCKTIASPGTKLIRLTHAQYDNTVRDLFGLAVSPSAAFQKDPTFQGFDNNALGLKVADRLGRDYRRAAEDLALQVVNTPAARARVLPCTATTDACARSFIDAFGRRAFRRAVTAAESATYFALFKKADTVLDGPDPFTKGVELVIEAMLQTPHFLYRVELAEGSAVDGLIPLTGYELASQLSYLLWNTTPDADLLTLAETGRLATAAEVRTQALAMLADPRADATVDDFHHQWLELDHYENLTRDAMLYPGFTPAHSAMMQEETLRFVREVVLRQSAPFSELFTANYSFVNQPLASIYGLTGTFSPTAFSKVTLPAGQRAGLLTQTGFLAAHSYTRTSSPIHRGVFVIKRVLCQPQSDPPPNADLKLPPMMGSIKTTRQQVAAHTSPAGCATCHTRINGMGFAFEHYDAIGQHRDVENGEPVDSTGALALGDAQLSFKNGLDFSAAIANSPEARGCYALHWMRYAYQRAEAPDDACDVEALSGRLAQNTYSIRDLIGDLTQTRSFLNRPSEVAP